MGGSSQILVHRVGLACSRTVLTHAGGSVSHTVLTHTRIQKPPGGLFRLIESVRGNPWIRLDTGQEDTDRETQRHVGDLGHCGTEILGYWNTWTT